MAGLPQPTAQDLETLADWGLSLDCLAKPEPVELWPCNEMPIALFSAMLTQWRMGYAGPVGLDYGAVPLVARMLRLRGRRLTEAFAGLRVCEAEALAVMAEQREQQRRQSS